MRAFLILALVAIFALPHSAAAQCSSPILELPDGHVVMTFSATERRAVLQDLLVAKMSYATTNRESQAVQDKINTVMKKAIERAKKDKTVKVQTGNYQVYEVTDPRTREKQWRGKQNLTIQSKNADDVLALAGDLQDLELTMDGLSYTLDPGTAISIKDNLMEKALEQLQTRAQRAAKALRKNNVNLKNVSIERLDDAYPLPEPFSHRREMKAAAMGMTEPVAEASEATIRMTVSATAVLTP